MAHAVQAASSCALSLREATGATSTRRTGRWSGPKGVRSEVRFGGDSSRCPRGLQRSGLRELQTVTGADLVHHHQSRARFLPAERLSDRRRGDALGYSPSRSKTSGRSRLALPDVLDERRTLPSATLDPLGCVQLKPRLSGYLPQMTSAPSGATTRRSSATPPRRRSGLPCLATCRRRCALTRRRGGIVALLATALPMLRRCAHRAMTRERCGDHRS